MSSESSPPLSVAQLSVRYGEFVAVRGVDLSVRRGELLALVGPSGCGKTSLLRAIAGFERPCSGRIEIDGELVEDAGRHRPPEKRRLGMVFQQGALFPHLTVVENVAFGLKRAERRDRAEEILELVALSELRDRYPDQLSGGQQQLVALARALAPRPRLVLLDEPFASLDAERRERIRDEVAAVLRRAGATAICVTHDQNEALSIADRVAVMEAGEIRQLGSPEMIYQQPASLAVAQFIGDGALVPCQINRGIVKSAWGDLITELGDGEARLLIRPEALRIVRTESGAGSLEATIERGQFRGQDHLYDLRCPQGRRYRVRDDADAERFPVGSVVRIQPRRPALWLVREGESGSARFER